MASNISKKILLYQAKNKDPEAYSKVYDLYVDQIYRFIFFKVPKQEDAQDLCSEVFLKTWQYIIEGNKVENLNALFYKIARNLIVDFYRRSSVRKEVSLDASIGADRDDRLQDDQDIEENLDIKIQTEKVEDRLKELKDEYREVVILRYIEGFSITEISEIMGKKKGAVRVLIYRATKTLKDIMESDGSAS